MSQSSIPIPRDDYLITRPYITEALLSLKITVTGSDCRSEMDHSFYSTVPFRDISHARIRPGTPSSILSKTLWQVTINFKKQEGKPSA